MGKVSKFSHFDSSPLYEVSSHANSNSAEPAKQSSQMQPIKFKSVQQFQRKRSQTTHIHKDTRVVNKRMKNLMCSDFRSTSTSRKYNFWRALTTSLGLIGCDLTVLSKLKISVRFYMGKSNFLFFFFIQNFLLTAPSSCIKQLKLC